MKRGEALDSTDGYDDGDHIENVILRPTSAQGHWLEVREKIILTQFATLSCLFHVTADGLPYLGLYKMQNSCAPWRPAVAMLLHMRSQIMDLM